ncbi:MAG: hypothetical protein ABL949_08740 [Fimbriimonadaceae bacterium]
MNEFLQRIKGVVQWTATSFEEKKRQAAEGAAKFDEAWAEADRMGLVKTIDEIKPEISGPNAADYYEQMAPIVKALEPNWSEIRLLGHIPSWPPHYRELLELVRPILSLAFQAGEIDQCRFDRKYVTQPGTVQPVFSALKALYAVQLEIRRPESQNNPELQMQLFRVASQLLRHIAAEPVQVGTTMSYVASNRWFQCASLIMKIRPESRQQIGEIVSALPPERTLRSSLSADVLRSSHFRGFGEALTSELPRLRMPQHMISEMNRLPGLGDWLAAKEIEGYCYSCKHLPADEAADGEGSKRANWEVMEKILLSKEVLSIPIKWCYLTLPEPSRVKPITVWKEVGAVAAKIRAHRMVLALALEVYDRQKTLGRFPEEMSMPLDPVTLQPLFYRGHPDWFCITGKSAEFSSGPGPRY